MAENELEEVLAKVLASMVESDEGELFLVSQNSTKVHLHLRGRFAGCPGNGLVMEHIVTPLIQAVRPESGVEFTSGPIVPQGAERIEANDESLTRVGSGDTSASAPDSTMK